MSHKYDHKMSLDVQLVSTDSHQKEELALESMMTQSAFGHEYALMGLSEEIPFTRREEILAQLEEHKQNYFWAREQLKGLAPSRLFSIEENIRFQKENVFGQKIVLH